MRFREWKPGLSVISICSAAILCAATAAETRAAAFQNLGFESAVINPPLIDGWLVPASQASLIGQATIGIIIKLDTRRLATTLSPSVPAASLSMTERAAMLATSTRSKASIPSCSKMALILWETQ